MPITLETLEPLVKMAKFKISELTGEGFSLGKLSQRGVAPSGDLGHDNTLRK